MFHVKHLPAAASERPVVRVVLPSGALRETDTPAFDAGLARLEAAGFAVRFDPQRRSARWRDYYAGDDASRTAEFVAALDEPEVEIVWWGRGGAGSGRLVESLIDAAQARAPRIVIGFSDATAVLNGLSARAGWTTFHGPAITSLARTDLDHLHAVVTGATREIPFAGVGAPLEGRLFGGNLMVLTSILGTAAAPPADDTVWLLEEVNEPAYRVDRALQQLHAATANGAVGAWLGPLYGAVSDPDRVAADLRLPCVTGAPAGHTGPMHLLPLGVPVRIEPEAGHLRGLTPWVSRDHV